MFSSDNTKQEKIGLMMANYRYGLLGTPDAPDRSTHIHRFFWAGYFGYIRPDDLRNLSRDPVAAPCITAGAKCATNDNKLGE